jgi:hypothetical protein
MANDTDEAVILERIKNLQGDVTEIKTAVKCGEKRAQEFERLYIKEHGVVEQSAQAAHDRLDIQDERMVVLDKSIKTLVEVIQPLVTTNNVLKWVGGLLGGSIFILIWMIILGQVQLVFG